MTTEQAGAFERRRLDDESWAIKQAMTRRLPLAVAAHLVERGMFNLTQRVGLLGNRHAWIVGDYESGLDLVFDGIASAVRDLRDAQSMGVTFPREGAALYMKAALAGKAIITDLQADTSIEIAGKLAQEADIDGAATFRLVKTAFEAQVGAEYKEWRLNPEAVDIPPFPLPLAE